MYQIKKTSLRIQTDEPVCSSVFVQEYGWMLTTTYGSVREILRTDATTPLGEMVRVTLCVGANMSHNNVSGQSFMEFVIQTPIDWFSKSQAMVETDTCGAEFVTPRTCVKGDIDLQMSTRYPSFLIHQKTYMFGDDDLVVTSFMISHARHKRHNALLIHRVREVIAAKIIGFYHIVFEPKCHGHLEQALELQASLAIACIVSFVFTWNTLRRLRRLECCKIMGSVKFYGGFEPLTSAPNNGYHWVIVGHNQLVDIDTCTMKMIPAIRFLYRFCQRGQLTNCMLCWNTTGLWEVSSFIAD
jgi:hypothetical protein